MNIVIRIVSYVSHNRLGEYKALIILSEVETLDKDIAKEFKVRTDGFAEKNKHVLDFQEISFTLIT